MEREREGDRDRDRDRDSKGGRATSEKDVVDEELTVRSSVDISIHCKQHANGEHLPH